MKITKIDTIVVHIPLKKEVFVGKRKLGFRDHVIVKIFTDDGYIGNGYTFGYGAAKVLALAINELLKPHLLGEDPLNIEHLWNIMYQRNFQVGRRGIIVRAISAVDIALWDIKCKAVNLPLYKVLGAYREKVPVYTSGGYYREFGEKGLKELEEEMSLWAKKGYKSVKMRVGLAPIEEDVKRIQIAKKALGEKVNLMLDAELVWEDAYTAIKSIRAFEENNDLFWIEGPGSLDRISMHKEIRRAVRTPIATGGQMYTRWEFLQWMEAGAVDILQPDGIVCGGISEWLKIAHISDTFNIKIAPHGNWNLHASLAAAVENALFIEYFELERDVKVFDKIVKNPVKPDSEGFISPPKTIGVGIEFDEDKIEEFKVI